MADFETDPETIKLRKKIDELLKIGGANDGMGFLASTSVNYEPFMVEREDSEAVQNEVRTIIKQCLQVEDEAKIIKGGKTKVKQSDLLYHSPNKEKRQPTFVTEAAQSFKPSMSKDQKKLFQQVVAKSDQETAEDFEIALELLNRYKKDKNFIQKDD